MTLYAQWTPIKYTVSFDANGGTGSIHDYDFTYDQEKKLPNDNSGISNPGHTLTGWSDGTRTYKPGESVSNLTDQDGGHVTLKAVWEGQEEPPASTDWNIHFVDTKDWSAEGVKDAPTMPQDFLVHNNTMYTVATGKNLIVNIPDGWELYGWNLNPDGSGKTYAAGEQIGPVTSNMTVYAVWRKINMQQLTYDANGGVGAPQADTARADTELTVSDTKPTRDGYTFTGWNTKADGSGTSVQPGKKVTMPETGLTLYAQWQAESASIRYDANHGEKAPAATEGKVDTKVTVTSETPTREGYTFTGWNTKADGSGTAYKAGQQVTMPVNGITLYAQWAASESIITYDANGGTGSMDNTMSHTGETVQLPESKFTNPGRTFTGWNTRPNGTGDMYQPGSTFTMPVDGITLYAQWAANASAVSMDANGGTGTMSPLDGHTGDQVTVPENTFTRDGYDFTGWNTDASGKGTAYKAGDKLTLPGGPVTLYAQWKAQDSVISYDANQGEGEMPDTTASEGGNQTAPDNKFTRPGYDFNGWNTAKDGSGSTYQPGDDVPMGPGMHQTLYAQWKAQEGGFNFDLNGGRGSVDSLTGVTGDKVKLPDGSKLDGCGSTLTGWNTAKDGSGTAYKPGEEVQILGDVTLYAQWDKTPDCAVKQSPLAQTGVSSSGLWAGLAAMLMAGVGLLAKRFSRKRV